MKYICKCLIVVLWLPCNSLHCCELQQQCVVGKILNTSIILCYPFLWLFYNCYMLWFHIARIKARFLPCCSLSSTFFLVSVGNGVMVILQLLALFDISDMFRWPPPLVILHMSLLFSCTVIPIIILKIIIVNDREKCNTLIILYIVIVTPRSWWLWK